MMIGIKRKRSITRVAVLLCAFSAMVLHAEDKCQNIALEANETTSIPISNTLVNSEEVFLSFSARINTQQRYLSGSATALLITVNNIPVIAERLKNKRRFYIYNGVNKVNWFYGNSGWAVSYYPWDKAHTVPGGEVHNYVFDIKSLLKPDAAQNTVTLKNTAVSVGGAFLEIRDLRILNSREFTRSPLLTEDRVQSESKGLERFRRLASRYHKGVDVELDTGIDYRPDTVQNIVPRESFKQDYKMSLDGNGQLVVEVNGDSYVGVSHFRTPGGPWRSIGDQDSASGWSKYVVTNNRVVCENSELSLTRTITKTGSHIIIEDVFDNKTTNNLPVVVMNTIDLLHLDELSEFRIAGNKQPQFSSNTTSMDSRETGSTPVAYLEKRNSGLGVVVQDDVYRNQASYLTWGSTLGIGDDLFYLAPGSQYTMVWKIFPVQEKNYYQLVNAIRSDWGFSREIPGLFGFVHPSSKDYGLYKDAPHKTPEAIAAFLDDSGLNVASTVAMLPRNDGLEALTGNETLEQIREGTKTFREWRDKAKQGGAKVFSLPYLDVHLVKPFFDGGLSGVSRRLSDSLIKDAYGDYLPYSTGTQWLVLPRLDNACGKHLMNVLQLLLDEQEFDGVYVDEWDHSRARVSFNHYDGYSAIIDEDANFVRRIGFVPLLTREFQKVFVEETINRGKMVFANQFDGTMSSAKLPVIHFAEPLGSYDYKLFAVQLTATPLSLHVARTQSLWSDVEEFLKRGVLTCYYFKYFGGDHILKKCFPITVKEVWPGYVVGERKIVTMCSGRYSFKRKKPLTAFVYSEAGLCQTTTSVQQADGSHEISLELDEGQVAVVEEEKETKETLDLF